ncbi:MAG: hypothetical protein QXX01_01885 [Candidatus Aenigmatarchaeota archaeon]|nr:hypothetical protein [Candidatus Aenigmarchaeota archaeon]
MHFSLETFISVAILLTFIVYIYQPPVWQPENEIESVLICIKNLDLQGKIRENVLNENYEEIKKNILLCVKTGIDIDLKINSECNGEKKITYYIYGNNEIVLPKSINVCIRKL